MTQRTRWIGLAVFLVLCLGAGGLGAIATTPEIDGWYRTLTKPTWNPPDSVFGPVWTTLYVLMAIAAYGLPVAEAASEGAFVWIVRGAGPLYRLTLESCCHRPCGRSLGCVGVMLCWTDVHWRPE